MEPSPATFLYITLAASTPLLVVIAGFSIVLKKVREVHGIVNSQRQEMLKEIDDLKKVIAGHAAVQVLEEARQVLQRERSEMKEQRRPELEGS